MALDILALHMLGDYILQSDWMATNKLTDWRVRAVHVSVYGGPFLVWGRLLYGDNGVLFGVLVMVTHFVIDSYRFAQGNPWPPKSMMVDQSLHIISLAVLARLFLR